MLSRLPIAGQGVFLFNTIKDISSYTFQFTTSDKSNGLNIEFTKDHVLVTEIKSLKPFNDPNNKQGLSTHSGAYYWFSIDAQNQRLYAGIGEARLETMIYSYTFRNNDKVISKSTKDFLESITTIEHSDTIQQIRILKDPITYKIPLLVKNISDLTMDDIALSTYMPATNLSPIGQKLYHCISGERFVLNSPDFPEFTQAIEHSIRTPGLWCYNKLRDKSTEFNPSKPNIYETYLRITLGQNNGESPGIPYVMEIWPVGHYSPIHSHANADAIIRVLNGEINVSLYPFLCAEKNGINPFSVAIFKENDVTWITPTLNQTHQLKNMEKNSDTCITIQCYMYSKKDSKHYDYFDYLDEDGTKQIYEPDSDMKFMEFKQKMREEWAARKIENISPPVKHTRWACWK